jgi:protocatechuate 3,4-dioxygenase beta subunit
MTRRRSIALVVAAALAMLLIVLALVLGRSPRDEAAADAATQGRERDAARGLAGEDDDLPDLGAGARLEGQVLDLDELGIAGAQVCASPAELSRRSAPSWRPRCVEADEGGRFVFESVAPGRYRLTAAARGYLPPPVIRRPVGLVTTVAAGERREGLILRLRPGGAEVRGIVRDITGGTVSGAWVFSDIGLTTTDDAGRFSLWLDIDSFVRLEVVAEGYAPVSTREWRPIGRELEILLRPEVVLRGRVVRADTGEGIADVPVLARAPRALALGGSYQELSQVRTDAEGRFVFRGLGPGYYKPEVRAAGWRGMARDSVLLVLGEVPEEVLIPVHPARQLAGRVIRAGSGEPCEAGTVTVHDQAGEVVERGLADLDGVVALGGLLPEPYTLEVRCFPAEKHGLVEPVDLGEGDLVDAVWELEAPSGRAIRGRVVDASGRGVALVHLHGELRESEDGDHIGTPAEAVTEEDGSFEILDLPPGLYRFHSVHAEGMAEPKEDPEVSVARDRDTEGVEIVLPEGGALRVRVRDPAGDPVPGATIFVKSGLGGTIFKSTPTSEWLLEDLTPEVYVVEVTRPGVGGRAGPDDPGRLAQRGESVEVLAGETAELTLTAAARKGTIAGFVRTREGAPIVDAKVWARASETYIDWGGREVHPEVAETVSEIDGSFTLEHLEAGVYTVFVRDPIGVEQSREGVVSDSQGVIFELPSGGAVSGQVVVADGDPPTRFSISVSPAGARGRQEDFLFAEGGRWRVVGLPPGPATVAVTAAEGTASTKVTIPEDGEAEGVVLELAARGSLRGRVVDAETGEGVAGYLASARSATGHAADLDPEGTRYSDEQGRFELRSVPSGQVTLHLYAARARGRGYGDVEVTVEVTPGAAKDAGELEVRPKGASPEGAGRDPPSTP